MAKKKGSKTLIELINAAPAKASKQLGVPAWFEQAGNAPAQPDAPEGAAPPPMPPAAGGQTGVQTEPAVRVSGGMIELSLSPLSALLIGVGVIVLIFGAFLLGRRSVVPAPAPTGNKTEAPLRPDVLRISGRPRVVPVPAPPAVGPREAAVGMALDNTPRKKERYYLVIQSILPEYENAYKIKRFLHTRGIRATIHQTSTNRFLVKDLQPFKANRWSDQEVTQYVQRIEQLGREYMRAADSNDKYDFRQNRGSTGPYMIYER